MLNNGVGPQILPPWRAQGELGRSLSAFVEGASISHSYNFLIYKWAEVVEALLCLRAATAAVPRKHARRPLLLDPHIP